MRRALSTVAAMIGVIATAAWAVPFHLHLLKSSPPADTTVPAAPDSIRLWFSQPPELKVTSVKVTGPGSASAAIALAPLASRDSGVVVAAVRSRMPSGAYTVSWRTMAKDGHMARGSFAFTVGAAKR